MMSDRKYTLIDFFCGAGGFSYGMMKAGYFCLAGVDNSEDALRTFELNHNGSLGIKMDLADKHFPSKLLKKLKENYHVACISVDVIIGSPPCQGFSIAGKKRVDDSRNDLYMAMVRAVKYFKPQAFILENVPNMASLDNGRYLETCITEFIKLGYQVNWRILNAADYGVPQKRHRLFIVGTLGNSFEFPSTTHEEKKDTGQLSLVPSIKKPWVTCSDALSDLPILDGVTDSYRYNGDPANDYQRMMREGNDAFI